MFDFFYSLFPETVPLIQLSDPRVKKSGHFLDNLKVYLSGFLEKDQVGK